MPKDVVVAGPQQHRLVAVSPEWIHRCPHSGAMTMRTHRAGDKLPVGKATCGFSTWTTPEAEVPDGRWSQHRAEADYFHSLLAVGRVSSFA
jgi:hypothetical protein